MSWIREKGYRKGFLQKLCENVLKAGPVPKHVAIIMDGNRRYAVKKCIDRTQGHLRGFDTLAETLSWCLDLGISEVTVYAFSIENFKRSKEEVDCLMEIAREKFAKLLQELDRISEQGVCVRVLGELNLLPADVRSSITEAVCATRMNTKATLNVCFAYTSTDEMSTAMQDIADGIQLGALAESDINQDLITSCLYTYKSQDPDILIRTSGEVRLSDFLLWQSSYSLLSFVHVLWPDFTCWQLYMGVLKYQLCYNKLQEAKERHNNWQEKIQNDVDLKLAEQIRELDTTSSLEKVYECVKVSRKDRTNNFLQSVHQAREDMINKN